MPYIYSQYEKQIWDALMADIQNEYGVAGLMGNLYGESSLWPGRVENDFTSGYSVSQQYTQLFQNGQVSREEFRWNTVPPQISSSYGPGYGLAQWTFYTRKYNYWDFATARMHGLPGTVQFETWFLLWELQTDYTSTYNTLINATSVNQASDYVLEHFENPAHWQDYITIRRQYSQNLYDEYAGSPPAPDPGNNGTAAWFAVFRIIAKRKNQYIYYRRKRGGL